MDNLELYLGRALAGGRTAVYDSVQLYGSSDEGSDGESYNSGSSSGSDGGRARQRRRQRDRERQQVG